MLGDPERVLGAKPRGLSVGKGVRIPPHGMEGTHTSMTCAEQACAEVVARRQGAEGDWKPC